PSRHTRTSDALDRQSFTGVINQAVLASFCSRVSFLDCIPGQHVSNPPQLLPLFGDIHGSACSFNSQALSTPARSKTMLTFLLLFMIVQEYPASRLLRSSYLSYPFETTCILVQSLMCKSHDRRYETKKEGATNIQVSSVSIYANVLNITCST